MQRQKIKVAVAMSGGVDSSVAAALLKKKGYDCIGIFMKLWSDNNAKKSNNPLNDVKKVAVILDIPIHVLNLSQSFKKKVVNYFLREYQKGNTPNPCVQCNKFIKFDLLLKKAKSLGCDFIATGHYCRLRRKSKTKNRKSQIFELLIPKDKKKDQSYFLYNLKQEKLKHILFPVGDYTKTQVRKLAKNFKLPINEKPESQEICFIKDKSLNIFLKKYLKLKPGIIIDTTGKKIGKHQGLALYTLGQRRGINIGGGTPFYVVKKYIKDNLLVVSNNKKDANLYSSQFFIKKINWITDLQKLPLKSLARIRYQAPLVKCQIKKIGGKYRVSLEKPQRAITPGQSVVFYSKNIILGGGVII